MSDVAVDDRQVEQIELDGVEFNSPEQLAEMMANDPEVWDKVMGELDNASPEASIVSSKQVTEDEKPAEQKVDDEEKKPEDKKPEEKPSDEKPAETLVSLDGQKIKPEWLGTYKTDERSFAEAIEQMHKGNLEKDKTIEYYKFDKTVKLQKERDEAVSKMDSLYSELKELKEKLSATPSQPKEEKPVEKEEKVELPEAPKMPTPPSALDGDDLYDDDKVKANKEAFDNYLKAIEKYNEDKDVYQQALRKHDIQEAARQATEKAQSRISELESKVGGWEKEKAQEAEAKKETAASEVVQREYEMIEEMRSQHADVLGTGRPISRIEADYVEFLDNLATIADVTGGIYQRDADGNTRIKTEITNALNAYLNPASPMGNRLREAASQKGISLPEDYSTLRKVYDIRKIRNSRATVVNGRYEPITYEEAFEFARMKDPTLNPKQVEKEKRDEVLDEHNRRERASQKQGEFAVEPPSSSSGAKPAVDNISLEDFNKALTKPVAARTPDDIKLLWAVVEDKKVEPSLFGLDESDRPGSK